MKGTLRRPRLGRLLIVAALLVASAFVGASTASADTTVSQTMPMTYTGTNMCTGETFTGTGNVHFDLTDSLSTDGIHHHLATRIDGLKAVAMITGKKYVVQDTYFDEFNFVGADEETFNITVHYIRVGEDGSFVLGDDFYEYLKTHITANDQGMVTAFRVDTDDMPCQ